MDLPREVIAGLAPGSISYIPAVMHLPDPIAAIFWEQNLSVTVRGADGTPFYPYLEHYRALGFLRGEEAPGLAGWKFEFEGDDLLLYREEGRMEEFNGAVEKAPAKWFDAMERTGGCLAMVGVGLGVDRLDLGLLERAWAEDRVAAAMINASPPPDHRAST